MVQHQEANSGERKLPYTFRVSLHVELAEDTGNPPGPKVTPRAGVIEGSSSDSAADIGARAPRSCHVLPVHLAAHGT